jgi:hypothetical protein
MERKAEVCEAELVETLAKLYTLEGRGSRGEPSKLSGEDFQAVDQLLNEAVRSADAVSSGSGAWPSGVSAGSWVAAVGGADVVAEALFRPVRSMHAATTGLERAFLQALSRRGSPALVKALLDDASVSQQLGECLWSGLQELSAGRMESARAADAAVLETLAAPATGSPARPASASPRGKASEGRSPSSSPSKRGAAAAVRPRTMEERTDEIMQARAAEEAKHARSTIRTAGAHGGAAVGKAGAQPAKPPDAGKREVDSGRPDAAAMACAQPASSAVGGASSLTSLHPKLEPSTTFSAFPGTYVDQAPAGANANGGSTIPPPLQPTGVPTGYGHIPATMGGASYANMPGHPQYGQAPDGALALPQLAALPAAGIPMGRPMPSQQQPYHTQHQAYQASPQPHQRYNLPPQPQLAQPHLAQPQLAQPHLAQPQLAQPQLVREAAAPSGVDEGYNSDADDYYGYNDDDF